MKTMTQGTQDASIETTQKPEAKSYPSCVRTKTHRHPSPSGPSDSNPVSMHMAGAHSYSGLTGSVTLQSGAHDFRLEYIQLPPAGGSGGLVLTVGSGGSSTGPIDPGTLSHATVCTMHSGHRWQLRDHVLARCAVSTSTLLPLAPQPHAASFGATDVVRVLTAAPLLLLYGEALTLVRKPLIPRPSELQI